MFPLVSLLFRDVCIHVIPKSLLKFQIFTLWGMWGKVYIGDGVTMQQFRDAWDWE